MRRIFLFLGVVGLLSMAIASTAGARATLTAKPSHLSFGRVALGTTTDAQQLTLINTGKVTIDVAPGTVDGNWFAFTGDNSTCTLAAGESCTRTIAFTARDRYRMSTTATFTWTGGTNSGSLDVTLTGTGI